MYYRLCNRLKLIIELSITLLILSFYLIYVYLIMCMQCQNWMIELTGIVSLLCNIFDIEISPSTLIGPHGFTSCVSMYSQSIYTTSLSLKTPISILCQFLSNICSNQTLCQFCTKKNIKLTITIYVNLEIQSNLIIFLRTKEFNKFLSNLIKYSPKHLWKHI